MMGLARLKPSVAVGAALILATVGVAVQGRPQPAPRGAQGQAKAALPPKAGPGAAAQPDAATNRALARQQLAVIDAAWTMTEELAQNARIEINSGTFSSWGRRRMEALRKAGAGKAETVAALEKYINDLDNMHAMAKARREAARATQLGELEIQYLRLEAEMWLNDEKAR